MRCEDSKKAGLKLSPELMLAEVEEILGNSTRLKPALLLGSAVAKVLGLGVLRAALNLAGWAKLGAISTSGSRSRGRPPEPDPPEVLAQAVAPAISTLKWRLPQALLNPPN